MRIVLNKKQKSRKAEKQKNLTVLWSYALTVSLSSFLTFFVSYGQTSTREEPVSLTREVPAMKINEKTQKIMPVLDMLKIEQEDAEDNLNNVPPRFGFPHETDFTLENSGEWIELPDGDKLWRLQIYCLNATSINLLYDHFWLPEGAKFFIYNNDYREYLGAFTSKNNKGKKEDMRGFSTGLIFSDNITLEYYLPKGADDMGIISVSYVVHGYRSVCQNCIKDGYGFCCSSDLHSNAMCVSNFKNEKDAVVLMIANGNRYCTGSLVNTTANELHDRHFIITAEECVKYVNSLFTGWMFYWHYESNTCTQPSNQPPLIYTQGASVVAKSEKGNFALLELHKDPGLEWDVVPYYLGWDRSGTVPTGANWIIHHPHGDIKKIADSSSPVSTFWMDITAWEVEGGFTDFRPPIGPEFGSEGAPLLNSNRKLIGQYWKQSTGYCGDDVVCIMPVLENLVGRGIIITHLIQLQD